MRYIVDLDDTISVHRNRDYENAIPRERTINRLRQIREVDKASRIIIYTARGMNSCNGDAALAKKKNEGIIKVWLARHGVPYDEIIFGKPLGDVYIDDKAIHTSEFEAGGVRVAKGFSGAECYIIGDKIAIKHCDNAQMQYDWYNDFVQKFGGREFIAKCPTVYALTLGALYLEYVPDNGQEPPVGDVVDIIRAFGETIESGENDIAGYVNYVKERAVRFGLVFDPAPLFSPVLSNRTFCHGDLTRSNIRYTKEAGIYLIDPIRRDDLSSHLLDAAKYRLSLRGLNEVLSGNAPSAREVGDFDGFFREEELAVISALEKTQLLRILPYAERKSKEILSLLISLYGTL